MSNSSENNLYLKSDLKEASGSSTLSFLNYQYIAIWTGIVVCIVLSIFVRNRVTNVVFYFMACVSFCFIYFVFSSMKRKSSFLNRQGSLGFVCVTIIASIVWLIFNYVEESAGDRFADISNALARFQVPAWLFVPLIIVQVLLVIYLAKLADVKQKNNRIRIIVSVVYALALSTTVFCANIFNHVSVLHHAHAYASSIYDVINLAPFSDTVLSIYGHYGILYFLPIKILHLFGMPYNVAVAAAVSIVAFITFIATFLAISNNLKNDVFYFVLMLAVGEIVCFQVTTVYWQLFPHRLFFCSIFASVITSFSRNKSRLNNKNKSILWILVILSLIWNMETGIVLMVATTIFVFAKEFDFETKVISKYNFKLFVKTVVWAICAWLAAYILVNLYNIACGGHILGFRTYMFPLLSNTYRISDLEISLPNCTGTWFGIMIFFLAVLVFSVSEVLRRKRSSNILPECIAIAATGLGINVYYINRAVMATQYIVFFCFIILLAATIDKIWANNDLLIKSDNEAQKNYSKILRYNLNTGVLFIFLFICLALAFSNLGFNETLQNRRNYAWVTTELDEMAPIIDSDLPEDTIGFGLGVPELYAILNRDTRFHVIDWADIYTDQKYLDSVSEALKDVSYFFANFSDARATFSYSKRIAESANFQLVKEYKINGVKFGFYARPEVFDQCKHQTFRTCSE